MSDLNVSLKEQQSLDELFKVVSQGQGNAPFPRKKIGLPDTMFIEPAKNPEQERVEASHIKTKSLPVITQSHSMSDLPPGWEAAYTKDNLVYYIDHTNKKTQWDHPLKGATSPCHRLNPPGGYMGGGSPGTGHYLSHPLHSSHTSQVGWDQPQVTTPVSEMQPGGGYPGHPSMMHRPSWNSGYHSHSHSIGDSTGGNLGYAHMGGPPFPHSRQHSVPAITNWDQQKRVPIEKGKMIGDPYLPHHTTQNSVDSGVPATPSYPQEYPVNDDMDSPINHTNAGVVINHMPAYHQSPMAKNIIEGLPGTSVDTGEQMDTTVHRLEPSIQYLSSDLEQLSQWV